MIIDNIIVIIVAIILITYLSVNYVKKYAPLNLLFIAIGAFALGIYVPTVYYGTQVNILTQVLLLLGIFIVPTIGSIIQYKDISFGVKLLYTRAKKYYNLGKYNKCIATVEKILNKYEKTSEISLLLANCHYELEEYVEAKENLYDVINLDREYYIAYFKLGNILEKENDIDSAIDMYKRTLKIEPTFYDAYEALGILLAEEGKYSEAEKVYKKALEYHKQSYELLFNLAMIQLELSKTNDAEKNLELALTINPNIDEATYALGNIQMLKGDYSRALELYSEILKSETYGLKAYYKVAIIYVTKNEFDKAMSIIEYLISSDANYIDMIENEFVFNAMRGRIDALIEQRKEHNQLQILNEEEEVNQKKKNRKNWFGRADEQETEKESILYDDIDFDKVGFRKDTNNEE